MGARWRLPGGLRGGGGALSTRGGGGLGSLLGDVLAVAGSVDVNAQGVPGEAVEDGHGDGGVAEVTAPDAEGDVGGNDGRGAAVAQVDEIEEGVSGGGLVVAFLDLAEADIVDDEQVGSGPGFETAAVGGVGEAGVQVVEQVDAAGIADGELLLAGAKAEGLEEVALAGTALAGQDEIVVAAHEVEAPELEDEGLVERGLKVPVEGFEELALVQSAGLDAASNATFELVADFAAEEVLEQGGGAGALAQGPGEQLVELREGVSQSEEGEVSSESLGDGVGAERLVVGGAIAVSFCHRVVSGRGSGKEGEEEGEGEPGSRS